jgi:hypothetical protein
VRAVPRLANYTLAFALQLRKKHGKTSGRVANEDAEILNLQKDGTCNHFKRITPLYIWQNNTELLFAFPCLFVGTFL